MTNKIIMVDRECIIREAKRLVWLGHAANPLREAVERVNEGKATEADLIALEAVPVFDAEDPDKSNLEICEKITRCKA